MIVLRQTNLDDLDKSDSTSLSFTIAIFTAVSIDDNGK